jgi:hypothetical protein
MRTLKYFKITSTAIIILGIIHVLATPVVIKGLRMLDAKIVFCISYMFVATGIAVIATGWLQYFILKKLVIYPSFITILKGTVIFILLLGIGAVAIMWGNPFAYIILMIALYELSLLRFLRLTKETH